MFFGLIGYWEVFLLVVCSFLMCMAARGTVVYLDLDTSLKAQNFVLRVFAFKVNDFPPKARRIIRSPNEELELAVKRERDMADARQEALEAKVLDRIRIIVCQHNAEIESIRQQHKLEVVTLNDKLEAKRESNVNLKLRDAQKRIWELEKEVRQASTRQETAHDKHTRGLELMLKLNESERMRHECEQKLHESEQSNSERQQELESMRLERANDLRRMALVDEAVHAVGNYDAVHAYVHGSDRLVTQQPQPPFDIARPAAAPQQMLPTPAFVDPTVPAHPNVAPWTQPSLQPAFAPMFAPVTPQTVPCPAPFFNMQPASAAAANFNPPHARKSKVGQRKTAKPTGSSAPISNCRPQDGFIHGKFPVVSYSGHHDIHCSAEEAADIMKIWVANPSPGFEWITKMRMHEDKSSWGEKQLTWDGFKNLVEHVHEIRAWFDDSTNDRYNHYGQTCNNVYLALRKLQRGMASYKLQDLDGPGGPCGKLHDILEETCERMKTYAWNITKEEKPPADEPNKKAKHS